MNDTQFQADRLVQKIRHFIITSSGRTAETAGIEEFYQAFVAALREEIMINWTATIDTFAQKKPRMLNYLSMEYLPGRLLGNNITNIGATELVRQVLAKMNKPYIDVANCEADPGLGNGGLGRLASCFLDSLATHYFPARAYGLRYQYGVFEQEVWNGNQIERPDCWLLNMNPWESRRDVYSTQVHFRGRPVHAQNKHGDDVYLLEDPEELRAIPFDNPIIGYSENSNFSVLTLRLWSTKESPRNFKLQCFNAGFLDQASENTCLTDVLYPNDQSEMGKRVRLKQEFLLVAASLQDILRRHLRYHEDLTNLGDKMRLQINDTHPALVIAELIRILMKNYEFTWKDAVETTQQCCSYTNHTILREALEEWGEGRLQELLPRQLLIIQKLNQELCNSVRARYPNDEERVRRMSIIENGRVRMANLAIYGGHKVNGVARLHSEILKKKVFPDFYEMFPDKFINVTNGVTQRRWLLHANPLLAAFITKRIGHDWIHNFPHIANLAKFANDPNSQQELLEIKKKNKQVLQTFLAQENPVRDATGKIIAHTPALGVDAIYDVHIKRFHEYKRQLLNALHLIILYQEIKSGIKRSPRMALIGGKAAAGYIRAKQILDLICAIAKTINADPATNQTLRIAFIENYNVSKAEIIIPAADLSEQISTAGWEASGTGNMKFAINGALTIGTEDGANIEMHEAVTDQWWPFQFGASAEENAHPGNYRSEEIYHQNETLRKAIDTLNDDTFAKTPEEKTAFQQIFSSLLDGDRFFILRDLPAYYETQKKVEELYRNPLRWAEFAIHNIAAMGPFSTDESINNYAKNIWGIEPCPMDPKILENVRSEYSEHDRCHIVNR